MDKRQYPFEVSNMTNGETSKPKKGIIKQFLGCVFLSLGLLNTFTSKHYLGGKR